MVASKHQVSNYMKHIMITLGLAFVLPMSLSAQTIEADSIPEKPLMQKAPDSKMDVDPYQDGVAPQKAPENREAPMPPLPPPPEERDIFRIVEKMPLFPGCTGTNNERQQCSKELISNFFAENLSFLDDLPADLTDHQVLVRLIVEKDGSLTEAMILRHSPNKSINEEVLRVVKLLPNFIPGTQRGRPVPVYIHIPVNVKLED